MTELARRIFYRVVCGACATAWLASSFPGPTCACGAAHVVTHYDVEP